MAPPFSMKHRVSASVAPQSFPRTATRILPFLKMSVVGDLISITRDDGLVFTYRVTGTSIADWNKSGIDRHASGFNLVLSTCYPFSAITPGPLRYLVHAELVDL